MNVQDPEDEIENQVEENVERTSEAQEEYIEENSPSYSKSDDLYSLFWKVININDSSKVGNLDRQEMGMLDMSVRDMQKIAMTAYLLDEPELGIWLDKQAQIILKTSSSKRGWLPELFVSAKRFSSKEKRLGMPDGGIPGAEQPKKGFWARIRGR